MALDGFSIRPATLDESRRACALWHYTGKTPSAVTHRYALINPEGDMVGCCTFGPPAGVGPSIGVCGPDHRSKVRELSRLALIDGLPANTASWFVSRCQKLLHESFRDCVLVSWADVGAGHVGFIYQALGWLYTGCSKPRTDRMGKGGHSRHYSADETRRVERSAKHRYVKFLGPTLRPLLRWNILPYPKGDTTRHEQRSPIVVQSTFPSQGFAPPRGSRSPIRSGARPSASTVAQHGKPTEPKGS